ncbi:Sec-independent protein translocase subunit TatA/TatB [Granulicella tundricola]|uniref:Sec-independent protein translocase protein TatA n=1 Tax=Granulicella tundricola (strain ATCC BAA-1859 / DSM 23138 / MP5ACTX9) TaxID=1198114 RepID=E8X0B4_GRATM|nr:twin-arginine translocase TatA/TatE family subunit [Granulicella tundricola]ADW70095.1 sec-independent translocation protein mttA/Hcf106 [Granulicella tundricola MP5ACTX9]
MELFQPWHIIIVVGLAVLFFGGKKLPELGKGLGEGFKGFKDGMKGITGDDTPAASTQAKAAENAHSVTPKADEPVTKA